MILARILFFLLILVNCSYADVGSLISYPPNQIMGFRGLDTRSSPPNIQDGRATALRNVKLSAALNLKQRYGYSVINDTLDTLDFDSPAIVGIFDSEFSNGNSWTLAFLGDIVRYDNSGTWTTIAGAPTITSSDDTQFKCIMALDTAICSNDVDVPIEITSTPTRSALDVSDLSDALTKVRAMIWYRNYLIFGNTVENSVERPTRFRWSNVGTTETWTDDDFVDISTFAGDEIIGFSELYGDLYIFLTKSIWRASLVGGDDVFVFSKVIDGIGAASTHAITVVNISDNRSLIIFLSREKHIYMFDGTSVADVGNIIQPTLNNLSDTRLDNAVAIWDTHDWYLSATISGGSTNDIVYDFQTEILEWTTHTQIDANAFARVTGTDGTIKTYFGNYESFVYWMDDSDLTNDVDGAAGIVDSTGTVDTATITGAQAIIDSTLTPGTYTGAVIRITSGTGAGEESIVVTNLNGDTGVAVTTAFSTTPDSTSVYSIGDIDSSYTSKWYSLGSSEKEKTFLGMLLWGAEASNNAIDISYALDFTTTLGSETVSLSPASASLWDVALWDVGTWSTSGDNLTTTKFTGIGNFIQVEFENNNIDETFDLYGFNILAVEGDTKQ